MSFTTRSQRESLLAWTIVALAIVQVLVMFLPNLGVGQTVAVRAEAVRTPLTPAGWAFAIWAVIYLWSFLYAVYQLLPGQRYDAILAVIRLPSAIVFALNALWVVAAQLTGLSFVTVLIAAAELLLLIVVLFNIQPDAFVLTKRRRAFIHWPFLLFTGWISLALFANISSFLAFINIRLFGLGETGAAAVLLVCACALCIGVQRQLRGAILYALPVVWGCVAIAAANVQHGPHYWMAALAVLAAAGVAWFTYWTRARSTRLRNSPWRG